MEQSTLLDVLKAMTEEQQNSVIAAVEALTTDSVYGKFFHETDDREERLQMAAAVLSGRHPSKAVNERLQKMIQDAPAAFDALSNADKEKTLQLANSILEKRADIEREIVEKNTLTEDEKAAILRTAAEIEGTPDAEMSIEDAVEICKRAYIKEQLPFMSFLFHSGAGTPIDPNLTKTDITALLREDLQQDEPAGKMTDAEAQERIQEYFIRQGEAGREDLRDTLRHLSEFFLEDRPDKDKTEGFRNSVYAALHSKQFAETKQDLIDLATGAADAAERLQELEDLRPYMKQVLEKPDFDYIRDAMAKTTTIINGEEVKGFSADYTETDYLLDRYASFFGLIETGSPLEAVIEAARKARAEAEKELPAIQYQKGYELRTIGDKFSNKFFSLLAPQPNEINGQISFAQLRTDGIAVDYRNKKTDKETFLFYDYQFDETTINKYGLKKNFSDYDYFLMTASDNLHYEGNDVVSLTKFWHEMGNTGSPSTEQLTELANAMRKGLTTIVSIDSADIVNNWGKSTNKTFTSPVLPIQILTEQFTANGNVTGGQVKINGFSPFFMIAQPLDRYSTWTKEILQLYTGRKTARYYSVLRFLIIQIGWMKNPKSTRSKKITYQSLYEHCGEKTARGKQLCKKMMYRLFDEVFKPAGYVVSYREATSGEPGVILNVKRESAIKRITTSGDK